MSEMKEKMVFVAVLAGLMLFLGSRVFPEERPAEISHPYRAASEPPIFVLSSPFSHIEEKAKEFIAAALEGSPREETSKPPISPELRDTNQGPIPPLSTRSSGENVPRTDAHAALVSNLGKKSVMYAANETKQWPLASLTKLVTAAVVLQKMDLDHAITILPEDSVAQNKHQDFQAGETYTAANLLKGMLIVSSNEAAEALARTYGRKHFISNMNDLARVWGLQETSFYDPTGLSPLNQSTAADLARLAEKLDSFFPHIFEISRMPVAAVTELAKGKTKTLVNINVFAGRPEFMGGKTGYTDEAEGNLLSLFTYQKETFLIIVMGTADRFGETQILYNWLKRNI